MEKMEFDEEKQKIAVKAIEDLCYHCKEHTDECPVNVALGELQQKYEKSNRPIVKYDGFELDAGKVKVAIKAVEDMCYHCKEHTDDCPIAKTVGVLQHYVK